MEIIRLAGLDYDFTIHDYTSICPRIYMLDGGMVYCNSLSESYCTKCIATNGTPFGEVDIIEWRQQYDLVLRGARKLFVPNRDVAQRMGIYNLSPLQYTLKPHPEDLSQIGIVPMEGSSQVTKDHRLIAIIGELAPHKGSHVIRQLAFDAVRRNLQLNFVVLGGNNHNLTMNSPNVSFLGRYNEEEIDVLLRNIRPDIALFPSVCPETFSYTLSIAFRNRVFPIAFDIGSIAQRIRQTGYGLVVPADWIFLPRALNDTLCSVSVPSADLTAIDDDWMTTWKGASVYYGK